MFQINNENTRNYVWNLFRVTWDTWEIPDQGCHSLLMMKNEENWSVYRRFLNHFWGQCSNFPNQICILRRHFIFFIVINDYLKSSLMKKWTVLINCPTITSSIVLRTSKTEGDTTESLQHIFHFNLWLTQLTLLMVTNHIKLEHAVTR